MLRKILIIIISFGLFAIMIPSKSNAQGDESFRMQLESILYSFKNYRFSTISIWEMKDIRDVRKIVRLRDEAATGSSGVEASAECLNGVDAAILQIIKTEVDNGQSLGGVGRALMGRGLAVPPQEQLECIYNYYVNQTKSIIPPVQKAYIVTTRKEREQLVPNTIIALIVSLSDKASIKDNINNSSPSNTFTYPELKEYVLDPKEYRSDNLYGLVENAFLQSTVRDVTLEAQGIGTLIYWFPPRAGVTKSLFNKEAEISSTDVQLIKRISEGSPQDMVQKTDELIISPDLISWKHFGKRIYVYEDGFVDTISNINNSDLPKYGVELKYGMDGINYPSFWSERLTLSAVWKNVKLGVILPTNGYSSIVKDVFNTQRRLTYAGAGISGEADFPFPVVPKSGVFQANFAYVLGDAVEGPIKRKLDADIYRTNFEDKDYLVRYNGQLHYTFAVSIDDDYLLRFGLGGTFYNMESWYNKSTIDTLTMNNTISYEKLEDKGVIGVSGKIDFMAINMATPFGASVQYFDEGLYTNVWLQVPIVENTFSLRFDAKGYFKAFTNIPRPWENTSVFIPMIRGIVFF